LHGDVIIGFVNYNHFVRGAKTTGHVFDFDFVQQKFEKQKRHLEGRKTNKD
jgi:hypothetical protein